jgi:multiple sugar transport system ATP-binding protein
LTIADGSCLVLVGPSGSGKSTALRMLAGLEPLDDGKIMIGGKDVSSVRPRDRDIAMVFQNYALYPNLNVAQNMGFALKQQGVPKAERMERVRDVANLLDLEPYLDRKPRNLSGGQRQRVAMGRAIVRPPAGVPDGRAALEPGRKAARPDPRRARRASEAPGRDHRLRHPRPGRGDDDGRTASPSCATATCSRSPPRRSCYHEPLNLFVAGFIGSPAMNVLPVSVGTVVNVAGIDIKIGDTVERGQRATLGFRPESVLIGESGPIPARIRLVEDLGSELFVHLTIDHEGAEHRIVAKVDAPVRRESR